jgi:hypothetical protein
MKSLSRGAFAPHLLSLEVIHICAEHLHIRFDATFYTREPILEVTLTKSYARDLCVEDTRGTLPTLKRAALSARLQARRLHETLREIIRCKSRGEKDFFTARWIAS